MGVEETSRKSPSSSGGIGASFLLGHAGVFGLASVIFHELGIILEIFEALMLKQCNIHHTLYQL